MNFAKQEKTAQLNGLFNEDSFRRIFGGKENYAVDLVFLLVTLFIDSGVRSKASCDLTQMNV